MDEKQVKKTLQGNNSSLKVYEDGDIRVESIYYDVKVQRITNQVFETKLRSLISSLVMDDINNEYKFISDFTELLKEVKNQEEKDALINFLESIQIGELGKIYGSSLMEIAENHSIKKENNIINEQKVERVKEQDNNKPIVNTPKQSNVQRIDLNPYLKRLEMIEMQYDELMQQPGKDPEDFQVLATKLNEINYDLYDLSEKANSDDKDRIEDLARKIENKRIGLLSKAEQLEDISKSISF